jgi:DNA-binding response OmpR family regulator
LAIPQKKILVADVELDTLNLIKIILEKDGYEVSTAATSVEGVLKAKSEQPDIILWDAAFGWQVCKILKSQEETKHIPIVISTILPITLDENSKKYADGRLQKPFKANELLTEVEKHIKHRKEGT